MSDSPPLRSALEARTNFRRGLTLCVGPPIGQRLLPGQALLLLTIADIPGPHSTASLAKILGTSRPRASIVLAAMEAAGWLQKTRNRQEIHYQLTTLGQNLIDHVDVVLRSEARLEHRLPKNPSGPVRCAAAR